MNAPVVHRTHGPWTAGPAAGHPVVFDSIDAVNAVAGSTRFHPPSGAVPVDLTITAVLLGRLAVESVRGSSIHVERTVEPSTPDRRAALSLAFVRQGTHVVEQDGRRSTVRTGDVGLLRSDAPFRVRGGRTDVAVVHLPVAVLAPFDRQLATLTARVLPRTPMVDVLEHAVAAVGSTQPDPGSTGTRLLERGLTNLVLAVLAELCATKNPALGRDAELRVTVRDLILHNLADPALGPQTVAARLHVSVRTVHRLFEAEHTTVAAFIRQSRLDAAASFLAGSPDDETPLAQVAARFGFTGGGTFARAFRDRFTVSPRDYRRGVRAASRR